LGKERENSVRWFAPERFKYLRVKLDEKADVKARSSARLLLVLLLRELQLLRVARHLRLNGALPHKQGLLSASEVRLKLFVLGRQLLDRLL